MMSSHPKVILTYENIQITENDLDCLKKRKYLNDKIINFTLKYMHRTLLNNEQQQKVHIFDSFFAEALDQMDETRTIRWLRRVNIFEKDYLLIPVNIDEHWFLIVVCHPMNIGFYNSRPQQRSRILTMDSMPHHASYKKPQLLKYLRNFIRTACVIQQNMSEDQIANLSLRIPTIDVNVKEQENNFDCGICLLENAEQFLINSYGIRKNVENPDVEFRLSVAQTKRNALRMLIRRLIEAMEIEKAVINSVQ